MGENHRKIKGCAYKITNILAANYPRVPAKIGTISMQRYIVLLPYGHRRKIPIMNIHEM